MVNVFAVPVFFIVFRETLETSIIVSVLLSFLKQQLGPDRDKTVYKKLRNQVCAPLKVDLHWNLLLPVCKHRFGGEPE
jgi:high-affinity Fe2+/Pb2+ permease